MAVEQTVLSDEEYAAWQRTVSEFRAVVGDINEPKYDILTERIRAWGESLVQLRLQQSPELCQRALQDASDALLVALASHGRPGA